VAAGQNRPSAGLGAGGRPNRIDKEVAGVTAAVADIADGATVLVSGFGDAGVPHHLLDAVVALGPRHLTVVSNNAGSGDGGVAALLKAGLVRRMICSFPRSSGSVWFERRYAEGSVELEVVPQGTLTERIRAAGAGIPAFFTPTAADTALGEGKERRELGGRACVLEQALGGDVALIKAQRADRWGNLTYHSVARNYGPTMAAAARVTIVEVAEPVVEVGGIDPEVVVTPGVYVDRVVHCDAGS